MLKWLIPSGYAPSVLALNPPALAAEGIQGLILDLDNTVVAWNASAPTEPVRQWIGRGRETGVRMCIVSNNFSSRTQVIGRALNVPVVAAAAKPIPLGFRPPLGLVGARAENTGPLLDRVCDDDLCREVLGRPAVLQER